MTVPASQSNAFTACKICTIRLEELCYRRAWWFRAFRETLATGIRLFAIALLIRTDGGGALHKVGDDVVRCQHWAE